MENIIVNELITDVHVVIYEFFKQRYERQVEEHIVKTLAVNKNCKILHCNLNNYTDSLQISFAYCVELKCIVYRVFTIQTDPHSNSTVLGHCYNSMEFEKFVKQTMTKFIDTTNKTKVLNDWQVELVNTDNLRKRNIIKEWEGTCVGGFEQTVDNIRNELIKAIA